MYLHRTFHKEAEKCAKIGLVYLVKLRKGQRVLHSTKLTAIPARFIVFQYPFKYGRAVARLQYRGAARSYSFFRNIKSAMNARHSVNCIKKASFYVC